MKKLTLRKRCGVERRYASGIGGATDCGGAVAPPALRGLLVSACAPRLPAEGAQETARWRAKAGHVIPAGAGVLCRRARVVVEGAQPVGCAGGRVDAIVIVLARHGGLDRQDI